MRAQKILQLILLLSAVIIERLSPASCLTPEQRELIDEVIGVFMRDNFVPGLALSIVENNGANSLAIGYGSSRIESETPFTSQTLVAIASVSKGFTGVLAAKVLNEKFPELGEGVLDTPIVQLVPTFNFTFSDRFRAEFTTFRDLLSHRSCLFDIDLDILLGMNTAEQYNYRTRYQPEICAFRAGAFYSNSLFALAGNLIAHLAGSTFEELTRNFFDELGMTNSLLTNKDGAHEELPNISHAYYRKDNQTLQFNTTHLRRVAAIGGAGGLLSTASDMSQYLKLHLNKGKVGNRQVVPEEVLSWVYKNAIPYSRDSAHLGLTGVYGYGLGQILAVYEGNPWIWHGGFWAPYESTFSLFPQQQFGLFISTNGPGTTGTYPDQMTGEQLCLFIFDIINGNATSLSQIDHLKYKLPESVAEFRQMDNYLSRLYTHQATAARKVQTYPEQITRAEPEDIIGSYGSPADGDVTISLLQDEDQTLFIYFGEYGYGNLIRESDVLFGIGWTSPIDAEFYANGNVPFPIFTVDFSVADQFVLNITAPGRQGSLMFYRDRLIDTLPPVPWDPNSCGPISDA